MEGCWCVNRALPKRKPPDMASPYLHHVTLSTGHTRRSPRSEVADSILAVLVPWLNSLVETGSRIALPAPGLEHFSATGTVESGSLLFTIWAPNGPHVAGKAYEGDKIPLVTFGVAQRSRQGTELWSMMSAQFGVHPDLRKPAEPWCATAIHSGIAANPKAVLWLGDFERCVAWAWITRNPEISAVKS